MPCADLIKVILILSALFNYAFSCQIDAVPLGWGGGGGGGGAGKESKFPGTFRATPKIGKPLGRGYSPLGHYE